MQRKTLLFIALVLVALVIAFLVLSSGSEWRGVDDAVVNRYGTELGAEPRQPYLNIQGDLLLFAFAAGGAVGGFAFGYSWRILFVEKRSRVALTSKGDGGDADV